MIPVHWFARGRRGVVALVVVVAGLTLTAGTSFGAAGPASCMGHEASSISPPGSLEEFPGGMPALQAFYDENFPDVPRGAITSGFARLHEGSHEACDEAVEGGD